jgi:hypothetical protein
MAALGFRHMFPLSRNSMIYFCLDQQMVNRANNEVVARSCRRLYMNRAIACLIISVAL